MQIMIQTAQEFAKFIWHAYLEERRFELLSEVADEKLSVIGTGNHEFYSNVQIFAEAAGEEQAAWHGSFKIEDESYETTQLSDSLYLIIGKIRSKEAGEDRILYDFDFRFSMICEYQDNTWKLIHIHQSIPDPNQGDDEFFPKQITDQSNRILRETIAAKTRELEKITEQAIQFSRCDALTGLLNRISAEKEINKRMNEDTYGALMMFDFDNFKQLNDKYGHLRGDKALQFLAKTMKSSFLDEIIGRTGGDEFIVYHSMQTNNAEELSNHISIFLTMWQQNKDILLLEENATLSIGIALYPNHGLNFETIWNNADKALYKVKGSGKNNVFLYE